MALWVVGVVGYLLHVWDSFNLADTLFVVFGGGLFFSTDSTVVLCCDEGG